MAHVLVNGQAPSPAGITPAFTAVTVDGDAVATDVVLHVKNGGAAATDVTVVTGGTVDGLAVADVVVNIPAGQERLIGPFLNRDLYPQVGGPDAGRVYVTYSVITSVTRAAYSL